MPLIDVPTVHAVTDDSILADPRFKLHAEAVFRTLGAAGAVHLRGRGTAAREIHALARALAPLQDVTGCRLVINDRVDIALSTGAWGVQLPGDSLRPADVRRIAPALHLGVSVHTLEECRRAWREGAEWVIAGHVFATPSHPGTAGHGEDFVREMAGVGAPLIAIGGIGAADAPAVRGAGAHGIAAIRGIWYSPDPASAASTYLP
jgi:thiazole tautomerase (transcriptional regulator TenI)